MFQKFGLHLEYRSLVNPYKLSVRPILGWNLISFNIVFSSFCVLRLSFGLKLSFMLEWLIQIDFNGDSLYRYPRWKRFISQQERNGLD